ncbi:hypothetical protein QFC24_004053 [Naganishia onofrii]|uniref:Uncharacterized protein n=1 Tax=Naganishia onofrii TaxID=1851511 RepID=A0ACC2XI00_9TREE|nr:hypothetical protein QFC24_004053 [Naganishia onofrii]
MHLLRLLPSGPERFERLTTQLKWRLQEGGGQAVYEIGVLDDGTLVGITYEDMDRSLETLELMAAELGATVMVLRTITLANPLPFPKALMAYDGGGSEDESECGGLEADGLGIHSPIKKKKSSKKLKKKAKSSISRTLDDQQSPRIPGAVSHTQRFTLADSLPPEQVTKPETAIMGRSSDDHIEYYERARRKCEAKMARRRDSSGFSPHELSGKQRKAWGVGKGDSIWDGYGDSDVDPADKVLAEDHRFPSSDTKKVSANRHEGSSPLSPVPDTLPMYGTPVSESWRARNMARALQQDSSRWQNKPILSSEERDVVRQARKSRKTLKDQQLWKSDISERHHLENVSNRTNSSKHSNRRNVELDGDDEGFSLFQFDTFSPSEPEGDALTHEALAALEATTSSDLKPFDHSHGKDVPSTAEIDILAATKRPKKMPKKRRVRVQRAEDRRLDLLRGDGTGADGMPLFMDPGFAGLGTGMGTHLGYALSDREDDDTNAISSVVRRLIGETDAQSSTLLQGVAKQAEERAGVDICAILSTSPTYTIKPTSPSAQHLFSLPLPPSLPTVDDYSGAACDPSPPSPSNTITLPLDNLSLSFSHCELCTADSSAVSSLSHENGKHASAKDGLCNAEKDIPGFSDANVADSNTLQVDELDLSNARLCVEALIVKKMDMDERYLDFSGFIL